MIWRRIRDWYLGRLVTHGSVIPSSSADSPAYHCGESYYERTPSAELLRGLVHFWLRHWQFLITAVIGCVSVIVAIIALG